MKKEQIDDNSFIIFCKKTMQPHQLFCPLAHIQMNSCDDHSAAARARAHPINTPTPPRPCSFAGRPLHPVAQPHAGWDAPINPSAPLPTLRWTRVMTIPQPHTPSPGFVPPIITAQRLHHCILVFALNVFCLHR